MQDLTLEPLDLASPGVRDAMEALQERVMREMEASLAIPSRYFEAFNKGTASQVAMQDRLHATLTVDTLKEAARTIKATLGKIGAPLMYCIESPHVGWMDQWRFPRSKRKRIRRKWANDLRNFKFKPASFMMGDTLVSHPSIVRQLKEAVV